MSIQDEVASILRKYQISHVWGYIDEDGNLRVGARRARYKYSYDDLRRERARLYYLKNRERIRQRQHEYYIRRRYGNNASISPPVDHEILSQAILNAYQSIGNYTISRADAVSMAIQVLQYFGFEDEMLSNHLEHEDLVILYQMEDLGLINSSIVDETVANGKPWKINKFILNKKKILEFSSMQTVAEKSADDLYKSLPEEVWIR